METLNYRHPEFAPMFGFVGPMNANKTGSLKHVLGWPSFAGDRTLFVEPNKGIRKRDADGKVVNNHVLIEDTIPFDSFAEMLALVDQYKRPNLMIDDAQFLEPLGATCDEVEEGLYRLRRRGITVVWGAIPRDFAHRPIAVVGRMEAMSDTVDHLAAQCMICRRRSAYYTQRLEHGQPVPIFHERWLPDTTESHIKGISYQPRCEEHYELPEDWNEYSRGIHALLAGKTASNPTPDST